MITFQTLNKLTNLVPQLIWSTFEFWLGFLQGINVAKRGVNITRMDVRLVVPLGNPSATSLFACSDRAYVAWSKTNC